MWQVNYVTAGERMRSCALSSLQVRLRRGPDLPVASQRRRSHPLHLLVLVLSGSPIRTHSTTPLPASPVSWLGRSGWALALRDASWDDVFGDRDEEAGILVCVDDEAREREEKWREERK